MKFLLAASLFLATLVGLAIATNQSSTDAATSSVVPSPTAEQEFYEVRIYQIDDYEKQVACESYLENALLPALKRIGIDRVGVFTNQDNENDHSVFVVIPFATIGKFAGLNETLANDKAYQSAAAEYFARDLKDPVYKRIESRFLKAFAGIPVMEIPEVSTKTPESHF